MNTEITQSKKKLRAALYLRVSTEEQSKEGHYGLEVQEERGRSFCESQEYSLAEEHIFSDSISGGLPREKRPSLTRLFEMAQRREIDVVVVYKTDRLARNLRILVNIIHDLEQLGVAFRSVTEPFDTTTSFGKANLNLFGTFAEFEKEMIRERTMNGRLKAAKTGKWVVGLPPYGYKVDKDTRRLVLVPAEAKIIEKIFHWLVHDKLSTREIERRMNEMKVPTSYSTKVTKRKTLNHWYKRCITRMITNETYTGFFYYRKYKRPFNNLTSLIEQSRLRPKEDWVPMTCPPIISREMFEEAKKQLLHNRDFAKRNRKREYMYSKLIYCSECNFKMFGGYLAPKIKWEFAGGRYYHGIYRNNKEAGTTKRCEMCPRYSEARLEPIWECLNEILRNPKNMLAPLSRYVHKDTDPAVAKTRLEEITVALDTVQRKQVRANELYINEQITKAQYDQYQNEYKRDMEKLTDEATHLQQALLTKKEKSDREGAVGKAYEQIKERLNVVSYEEKAKIISFFVERITLHAKEDYAEVVFKFSGHTQTPEKAKILSKEESRSFPLVLKIKTVSELERRREILMANPAMYIPKALV